jgi:SagB-type dehydrogenase family enzyme
MSAEQLAVHPGRTIVSLRLIDGVQLVDLSGSEVAVESSPLAFRPRLTLREVTPGLRKLLERLKDTGGSEGLLVASAIGSDGPAGVAKLRHALSHMEALGMIERTLSADDRPVVSLRPVSGYFRWDPAKGAADAPYVLSRFAYCRNDRGQLVLETPRGHAELRLHSPSAARALGELTSPRRAEDLLPASPDLDAEATRMLLVFLANAQAVVESPTGDPVPEDAHPLFSHWAFHDLLFHSRSRLGRHADPYGGTFPHYGRFEPLPVVKPMTGELIPLHRPAIEALAEHDVPFSRVMENRASLRRHAAQPIGARQLGEFLFRCARIKKSSAHAGVSFRPFPSGGALHSLEIYPVIDRCDGLDPGLYHYDPLAHGLRRVPGPAAAVRTVLRLAGITAMMEGPPQVLLAITSRFQRVQYKYQSVAYAVILKDVGCLYQTMYLVATAMGLAPCALGGGHSDLFAHAAGPDYFAETTVGEFVLGTIGDPSEGAEGERWRLAPHVGPPETG